MTVAAALAADAASPNDSTGTVWEDPPRPPAPTGAPVLSAEGIEGPLDWLLEMARAQKIDLAKLPIAALIGSFVAALDAALDRPAGDGFDLARWGDWLVMAATLTQLRSRLLLPPDAPKAKAALNEAEALRQQLVVRAEMQAAVDWLEQRPQLGQEFFPRGRPEKLPGDKSVDIADLLRACLKLLQVPAELAAVYRVRPPPFWLVSQAIARIEAVLTEKPDGAELAACLPVVGLEHPDRELRCRAAVAGTLMAGLELARQERIFLGQEKEWGGILVKAALTASIV